LERPDLSLKEAKTHIVDATKKSFNFFGLAIRMSRGIRTGKPYPHVFLPDKSLAKIKAKMKEIVTRPYARIMVMGIAGDA